MYVFVARSGERRAAGGRERDGARRGERRPSEDYGARHEALEGEANPAVQFALPLLSNQFVRKPFIYHMSA